ncbi:MAG: 4a-hydroxytetrahydrobiopterin dehydratase [Taibaiella sp.]|nr:4a-hydroxytetrahydrobiopterin dehydratase [Taibaiella sp.]
MPYTETDGKLVWNIQLKNQTEVAELVLKIAQLADAANHHPDMLLHKWNRLQIELFSHDVHAITDRDYALAAQIEALLT